MLTSNIARNVSCIVTRYCSMKMYDYLPMHTAIRNFLLELISFEVSSFDIRKSLGSKLGSGVLYEMPKTCRPIQKVSA
jgi:hypothetical protein